MNLIDKEKAIDAIYRTDWYHLFNGKLSEGAEGEDHALYKAEDVYKAIKEVPVVDAIPVEWLEEKLTGHPELPYAITDVINNVLDLWRAEQEEQNDTLD